MMMVVDPPRGLVSVDAAVQTTILVRGDHRVVTEIIKRTAIVTDPTCFNLLCTDLKKK